MHALGRWAALLTMTISVTVFAEDRIAIVKFEGAGGAKIRAQLAKVLCRSNKCVERGRGGKKVSVDAVVAGTIKGAGAKRTLELLVYTSEDENAVRRKLPMDKKGMLPKKSLFAAASILRNSLRSAGDSEDSEGESSDESDSSTALSAVTDPSSEG